MWSSKRSFKQYSTLQAKIPGPALEGNLLLSTFQLFSLHAFDYARFPVYSCTDVSNLQFDTSRGAQKGMVLLLEPIAALPTLARKSDLWFLLLVTWLIEQDLNYFMMFVTFSTYLIILLSLIWYSPFICYTTSWESECTFSFSVPIFSAISRLCIKASYSAPL